MESESIDGQDVVLVHTAIQRMVERARRGQGPSFLICNTYRFYGHHVGDIDRGYYRSKKEEEEWKNRRDPLKLLAQRLREEKMADEGSLARIERETQAEIESGVRFALDAAYPDSNQVDEDVYA
jgi:pyruvate dehydrogenase E1 component alpha subunit